MNGILHGTWSCHVCGAERDDEDIAVESQTARIAGTSGAELTANVRYCRDRPACRDAAEATAKRWLERGVGG